MNLSLSLLKTQTNTIYLLVIFSARLKFFKFGQFRDKTVTGSNVARILFSKYSSHNSDCSLSRWDDIIWDL